MTTFTSFTHPDVLTTGVRDGWADPQTDPTRIDWPARQQAAEIWFEVVDGRPVNPNAPTGVRYGRNRLGHWGEALAADAVVTARTADEQRWLLLVDRGESYGWALPGGMVDDGEDQWHTAERELVEQTGLRLPDGVIREHWLPRAVPDPRASDEAWIVTRPMYVDLNAHGLYDFADETALPTTAGDAAAASARWWAADTYDQLTSQLREHRPGARIFAAHEQLLRDILDGPGEAEMLLQTYIDDELADRDPADLRHLAESYLRLVAAIELTMADLSDWDDDELPQVDRLTRYLNHLSEATRGVCEQCRRAIYAPHATTDLPPRPWWHPRRWWTAAADAWTGLRYGGSRIAHTSCTPIR